MARLIDPKWLFLSENPTREEKRTMAALRGLGINGQVYSMPGEKDLSYHCTKCEKSFSFYIGDDYSHECEELRNDEIDV